MLYGKKGSFCGHTVAIVFGDVCGNKQLFCHDHLTCYTKQKCKKLCILLKDKQQDEQGKGNGTNSAHIQMVLKHVYIDMYVFVILQNMIKIAPLTLTY